jgi:lipopolysaccharide export system protein LptA
MSTTRQLRGTFGNTVVHQALLFSILAALASTKTLAKEPRLPVSSSDPVPGDDPLNPLLPMKDPASSPTAEQPGVLPAQPIGNKIGNGRTEITADETTFDPETHVATFRQNVVLKDPGFNVVCDKLMAYLKHDQSPKLGTKTARNAQRESSAQAQSGSAHPADDPHRTLDKAVAEMNPGGRLEITQDKVETDGSVTHSIGHGSKAVYNAITGTTVLTGMPDATKGTDTVVATDEKTVITLMRDGGMSTLGPHKVVIINKPSPAVKLTAP